MTTRRELANAIRFLAVDAVEQAKSGHPGMPMGMADIAEVLWNDFLIHNPKNPQWFNRDRFIVSNGHGSLLIYALLHLSGYALNIEDVKAFRQLHAKTPGHPEYDPAIGVETTTGPLGQGLANAVGMALAEKILAAKFNTPEVTLVDHFTYVFAGDGCLMEGISHEACSLAGTLGLGKLVLFFDDNGISIDGDTAGWFTENVAERFKAYGWHVIAKLDGHDAEAIKQAIIDARAVTDKPSIICCQTIIGYGSPNRQGKNKAHSDAMGAEEIKLTRDNLNWPHEAFKIPDSIYTKFDATSRGEQYETVWQKQLTEYQKKYPEQANAFLDFINKQSLEHVDTLVAELIEEVKSQPEKLATRKASQKCLNKFAPSITQLIGGSADLAGSNCVLWQGSKAIQADDADGNFINYGVREFAMFAIMNGLALHSGFIPYGGTFLTFVDYGRNAVRLAAMMQQQVVYVLTHDSVALGEDGPTHQPIEHTSMLRMTPNLAVWRPADTLETVFAWRQALANKSKPTALLLSRQNVTQLAREQSVIDNIARGAYILFEPKQTPAALIIATGAEVALALEAAQQLEAEAMPVRVVSMPSHDQFQQQDKKYQELVLPAAITARLAIEAGSPDFWYQYVGLHGKVMGINRYGESAPAADVLQHFGFTVEHVKQILQELFANLNTGVKV
ncbi:MAG: transketolase [Pseudomonadota bacterium]